MYLKASKKNVECYNIYMSERVVEYVFFFGLMGAVAFLLWRMFSPFLSALALSGVIVTICYPVYLRIKSHVPKQNERLSGVLSTRQLDFRFA